MSSKPVPKTVPNQFRKESQLSSKVSTIASDPKKRRRCLFGFLIDCVLACFHAYILFARFPVLAPRNGCNHCVGPNKNRRRCRLHIYLFVCLFRLVVSLLILFCLCGCSFVRSFCFCLLACFLCLFDCLFFFACLFMFVYVAWLCVCLFVCFVSPLCLCFPIDCLC